MFVSSVGDLLVCTFKRVALGVVYVLWYFASMLYLIDIFVFLSLFHVLSY